MLLNLWTARNYREKNDDGRRESQLSYLRHATFNVGVFPGKNSCSAALSYIMISRTKKER